MTSNIRVTFGEKTEASDDVSARVSAQGTQGIAPEHATDDAEFAPGFRIGLGVDPFAALSTRQVGLGSGTKRKDDKASICKFVVMSRRWDEQVQVIRVQSKNGG